MQNKKLFVILGVLVILVGAAAFIAGRMLNQKVGPMGLGLPMGGGDVMSVSIQIEPAPELPKAQPDVVGLFVERQDNTVIVSSIPMDAGGGGVVVSTGGDGDEVVAGSPVDNSGPKVEVVVTNETIIYKETTEMSGPPPAGGDQTIQQTVGEGTLDDLNSQSFVTVWGRKSGDRIIAEVLFYSNPVMFKRP